MSDCPGLLFTIVVGFIIHWFLRDMDVVRAQVRQSSATLAALFDAARTLWQPSGLPSQGARLSLGDLVEQAESALLASHVAHIADCLGDRDCDGRQDQAQVEEAWSEKWAWCGPRYATEKHLITKDWG